MTATAVEPANASLSNVQPRTCAWGAKRGDRVALSVFKGRVYVWNHAPGQRLGIGVTPREALFLAELLKKAAAKARSEQQAYEAAAPEVVA